MSVRNISTESLVKAKKPIFFCSFGKDSSCILHAIRPMLNKILVVFIDCGVTYPDVLEWAKSEGGKLPKFMLFTNKSDWWEESRSKGFPVDFDIPALSGFFGKELGFDPLADRIKIRSWTHCIYERFWVPVTEIVKSYKPDLIVSGERQVDHPYKRLESISEDGLNIPMWRPLLDWSDADVWDYIDRKNIQLPKTYQGRQSARRDCWACLGGHDFTAERLIELKRDWPKLYNKLMVEEGFAEVIPAMLRHVEEGADKLRDILKLEEKHAISV